MVHNDAAGALGLYKQRLLEAQSVARKASAYSSAKPKRSSRYSDVVDGDGVDDDPSKTDISTATSKTCLAKEIAAGLLQEEGLLLEQELKRKALIAGKSENMLCDCCGLPLGEIAYQSSSSANRYVHGECKAECIIRDLQREEKQRKDDAKALKQARREEFGIGWSPVETVPDNASVAGKLGCKVRPQGLACLVMEGDSVRVAPTLEPAAAVNLEYLATALQVRRTEGKEPLFSLDPVEGAAADKASMQMKRWEPEWLAGTSLGEVLFQADYHLKELSFGEYDQPVVGMKSCFDFSETDAEDTEWSAREWFVVRKAEMHVSGDKVLVPYLKMGVEAREQVVLPDGSLEDAPMTRPDHPLVLYADAFTFNFDLIAERKSVVNQLREVAKASIMAKYLLESGTSLSETWFTHEGALKDGCCSLEVPQLWNDRYMANISLKDGTVAIDKAPRVHGLYGGVDFGIDRFRLSAPSRVATSVVAGRAVLGRPASSLMATSRTELSVAPARQFARLSAPLTATMPMSASRANLGGVPRVAASLNMGVPQGVDLNLDQFNLSVPTEDGCHWQDTIQVQDETVAVGEAFWKQIETSKESIFSQPDQELFKQVFNPHLSDRRSDAQLFAPPRTSATCMQRLRILVKSEEIVRQQREEHFCSQTFDVQAPGPLFPGSWTSSFGIKRSDGDNDISRRAALTARRDYLSQSKTLLDATRDATPLFARHTEDGMQYRIYKLGSIQVRTVQPWNLPEKVVMVFEVSRPPMSLGAA